MLSNIIKINNIEYNIREGSYIKKKKSPTIPRYGVGDVALSDLTTWNFWSQSLWHGGFKEKYLSTTDMTKFYSSNNVDVFSQVGSIKLAKGYPVSAALSAFTNQIFETYYTPSSLKLMIGNSSSTSKMKMYYKSSSSALSTAYTNASAGSIYALKDCSVDTTIGLLMSTSGGAAGNSGRLKRWTAQGSAANLTGFNQTWSPQSIVMLDNIAYLVGNNLMKYDLVSTFTTLQTNLDITGSYNMNACGVGGNVYWITYSNSKGRLWKYTIYSDTRNVVYNFGDELEPEICVNFRNKVIIGGLNPQEQSASLWEYNPQTDSIKNIILFKNEDDEYKITWGYVYKDIFYFGITGNNNYIYQYDGEKVSNFIQHGGGEVINACAFLSNMIQLGIGNIFRYSDNITQYRASGSLESSKIDFGLFGVDKYIGGLTVVHEPLASYQTGAIKVRIDDTTAWSAITQAGYNASIGSTSFDIELLTNNTGSKLEYQLILKSISDVPEITDVLIRYLLAPNLKWEWYFDLLLADKIDRKNTAKQLVDALESAYNNSIIEFVDINNSFYSSKKSGTTDRGIIFDELELLGPYNQSDKSYNPEYIARVHLIEG